MITTKNDRCPTIEELLDVCWCVQIHADGDRAFVFDTTGDVMVAILECNTGLVLPALAGGPADRLLPCGDNVIRESYHGPRTLSPWLNRCRDRGVTLAWAKSDQLQRWWGHGCNRLDACGEAIRSWLEV